MTTALAPDTLGLDPLAQGLADLAALGAVDWDAAKDRMVDAWHQATGAVYQAEPLAVSPVPAGTDIAAAVLGSQLLGMTLTPQGCVLAGVLEARNSFGRPLYDDVTIEVPRRATKTTTVQAVLLGRCEQRPGYRIIQTAQDGTRASLVFMDMVRTLERVTPNPVDRNWTVFKSTGREYLEWANGSRWWVAPPKASSYRGLAADVLFFDEAGELSPEESDDLEAGALPVMDTRPDGQVIKAGTPGLVRAGLFWKSLVEATETPQDLGVCRYGAREAEVVDLAGDDGEDKAMALLYRVHPGLACGLTTEAKMRKRFRTMDLAKFIREYLCVWPPDTRTTALNQDKWAAGSITPVGLPTDVPVSFGFNVGRGGVAAAVVAAWYDTAGQLCLQVMEYRVNASWLPADLAKLLRAHPGVPVAYDPIGDNLAAAQAVARLPRVNTKALAALALKQVAAGTAAVALAVDDGSCLHGISPSLDKAVASATWRDSNGSRLFRQGTQDLSALLAAVHATAGLALAKRRGGGAASGYDAL